MSVPRPLLSEACLRWERAAEHLTTLKNLLADYATKEKEKIFAELNEETKVATFKKIRNAVGSGGLS
jgi:hypothetical protein